MEQSQPDDRARVSGRLAKWALVLAIALVAAVVGYGLYLIRSVIISVFLAVVLTYILLPGVEWLCRNRNKRISLRIQRLVSTILIFVVFLSLMAALVSLFVEPFASELGQFTSFVRENFGTYVGKFPVLLEQFGKAFQVDVNVRDFFSHPDLSKLSTLVVDVSRWAFQIAGSSIKLGLELFLIPVLAFYFTYDYRSITHEMYSFVPPGKRREAVRMGRCVGELMQSYIFGQVILCVIAGVLTGIFLGALGIKYALVLAIFSGVTRAIPVIGPIVSGVPIILVGALTAAPGQRVEIPLILLAFVIVMHFGESKFIMPHLIGRRMRLHPAIVIIVLLIGAAFFGLVGMFIAAPVAAIIREVVLRYYIRPRDREFRLAAASAENVR